MNEKMYLLVGDFYHAISLYAQIIISELCLTNDQKTIKPVDVGGFVINVILIFLLNNEINGITIFPT